ncbi:MAG: hypothetical protein ABI402_19000 [Ferruginibacter sp.]
MLKLNQKFIVSSGTLHKISFGPFKTIDINKGKQHLVGRQEEVYLDVKGKNTGIKKGVNKIKSQPFSLVIIQDEKDTIISNMDVISMREKRALVEIRSGKAQDDESTVSYFEDISIQTRSDSLNWQMTQDNDQEDDDLEFPLSFKGILTNGADKILAEGADGFPVKRKTFANSTKGIVFLYKKKQVAALETYPETSIWFSNDINKNHKQVIAAAIISILSLLKYVMK